MAFGDQIHRQTKTTTDKCHECESSFIQMSVNCHAINKSGVRVNFIFLSSIKRFVESVILQLAIYSGRRLNRDVAHLAGDLFAGDGAIFSQSREPAQEWQQGACEFFCSPKSSEMIFSLIKLTKQATSLMS